ncbi:hypothetical protein CP533_0044 [Ophiocordyceps camponoti-saundersi (nom. inval.)]|nr:hypothetical protein CP533_0044 [Ophiocordyceps camponoti-saundersi (nom. inval.)]
MSSSQSYSPGRGNVKTAFSNMFRRSSTRPRVDEKQIFISETNSVNSRSSSSSSSGKVVVAPSKSKNHSKTPKLPTLVMPPIRYYN